MLINGETAFSAKRRVGEVVRLYLVNTANTRIFNFAVTRRADEARRRRQRPVRAGDVRRRGAARALGARRRRRAVRRARRGPARAPHAGPHLRPRRDSPSPAGRPGRRAPSPSTRCGPIPSSPPSTDRSSTTSNGRRTRSWRSVSEMPLLYGDDGAAASLLRLPDAPGGHRHRAGTCPKCGMKLIAGEPRRRRPTSARCTPRSPRPSRRPCPMCGMKLVPSERHGPTPAPHGAAAHGHDHGDGLEWEDLMPDINRESDAEQHDLAAHRPRDRSRERRHRLGVHRRRPGQDPAGQRDGSDHPMHHPFHIHGAGRFLVLSPGRRARGQPRVEGHRALRAGQTVDILLDVINPGLWMAHCHIAEHNQSGMMFSFDVARRPDASRRHDDRPQDTRNPRLDRARSLWGSRRRAPGRVAARVLVVGAGHRPCAVARA